MNRSALSTISKRALTLLRIGNSMKMIFTISSIGLLSAVGGCGGVPDFGGGASVVPDVTYVSASSAESGASSEAATDVAGATAATGSGVFTGKVLLSGSVNPLPALIQKGAAVKDMEVCAAVETPDERLVLGTGNSVQGVFIYLNKAPKGGKPLEIPTEAFSFDQKNCRFLPHCVVIPCGQLVKVLSADTVAHNTHTYPQKNPSVNSGVAPEDREGKLTFTYRKAESVPLSIKCDYHTWMTAYQLPVDHPYAAVTDENGQFTIPDLPAGKHSFIVWHEAADGGFVERKLAVEIKSGDTTEIQIDYPVDMLKL